MASQPPGYNASYQVDGSYIPQPVQQQTVHPSTNEKAALAGYNDASYVHQTPTHQQTHGNYQVSDVSQAQSNVQTTNQGNQPVRQANHYPNAVPLASLEKAPAVADCPICGQREMTLAQKRSGGTTHCSAILCCLCCCLGCVPYLFGEFKDTIHKCGSCGAELALYHRSGSTEVLTAGRAAGR